MNADALAVVSERDARGEIAEIYADIRATMGLPVVNLVWRHFATLDGGLRHAWDMLRPVYASGAAAHAGARLVAALALPRLPPVPDAVLTGAGVAADDRAVVAAILDSYNRGNALNLCALSALLAAADAAPASDAAEAADTVPALPRPGVPIPPMPELDDMAAPVRALVWQVNTLGQPDGDRVLASAWKHLAPWPGYLSLCWALLAPLQHDGRLAAAIGHTRGAARTEGARLAAHCGRDASAPAADAVRRVASEFVERVIVRMVPAVYMLRRALPDGAGVAHESIR